jgi:NAD-dependent SIR2 family protein deacetylase
MMNRVASRAERGEEDGAVSRAIAAAAAAIARADALLVSAGAGMGVDSGLPDFRGDAGFWAAYPAYAHLGLSFVDLANPRWFRDDPHLAWGFYGHRLNLYRETRPHAGFEVLRGWAERCDGGAFVFTSNVDGQFQRAGFDAERIVECHGALESWQCTRGCGAGIFAAAEAAIAVDERSFRAGDPLPACADCGALARPNVLMFGDGEWDGEITAAQIVRFENWLRVLRRSRLKLAIVECGAGTTVPTVRLTDESLVRRFDATLIRINVREPAVPPGGVAISLGARHALERIDAALPRPA